MEVFYIVRTGLKILDASDARHALSTKIEASALTLHEKVGMMKNITYELCACGRYLLKHRRMPLLRFPASFKMFLFKRTRAHV